MNDDTPETGVAAAWRDAARAAFSHPSAWGIAVAAWILGALSLLFCGLPFLVVGPLLAWGVCRSALDALDGTVEFDTMLTGLDHPGAALPGMLTLGALGLLAWAPGLGIAAALGLGGGGAGVPVDIAAAAATVALMAWTIAVPFRFAPAPFLYVESASLGLAPVDAMAEAWARTGEVPGTTALLGATALTAVALGSAVCGVGAVVGSLFATLAVAAFSRQVASPELFTAGEDIPLHPGRGSA